MSFASCAYEEVGRKGTGEVEKWGGSKARARCSNGGRLTSRDARDPSYGSRDYAGFERVAGQVVGCARCIEHRRADTVISVTFVSWDDRRGKGKFCGVVQNSRLRIVALSAAPPAFALGLYERPTSALHHSDKQMLSQAGFWVSLLLEHKATT